MSDEPNNRDLDSVIRKVQKILSKTEEGRNATEEEVDTAMRLAQEIMAKYNLDMATIEAAGSSSADDSHQRIDERSETRTRFKWQQILMQAVAEANFCAYFPRREATKDEDGFRKYGRDGRSVTHVVHRVIGRKGNVITTRLMFDYLCRAVEDSVPNKAKSARFSNASSSWKEGCAHKLCERLQQKRADLIAEHDARVKAEEDARAADLEKRKTAAQEKAERTLSPRPPTAKEVAEKLSAGARVRTGMKSEAPDEDDVDRPEIDSSDDWVPGQDVEVPEEAPPVVALVPLSVYDQSEQDLNEDMRRGWVPGTTTKNRLRQEAFDREWEEKEAEREAAREAARATETPRQRAAREKREEAEYEKWSRKFDRRAESERRKEAREHARRDKSAYWAGVRAGDKIGLDPQVASKADQKRIGGK